MNSRPGPGPGEEAAIRRSLRFANAMSFVYGLPGLALQITGSVLRARAGGSGSALGTLLLVVGTIFLIAGLGYAARYKGRSAWWGLMGLINCLGLIVLYFISKICRHCGAPAGHSASRCPACDSPV